MENYGVEVSSSSTKVGRTKTKTTTTTRLARLTAEEDSPRVDGLSQPLSLAGWQEPMAWSFFVASYTWGHVWRRWLVLPSSNPVHARIRSDCTLALVYGYFGAAQGYKALQDKSAELYARAVQDAAKELTIGLNTAEAEDQSRLATFSLSVLSLAFYSVSFLACPWHSECKCL
jgi:hypothetical protein